MSHEFKPHHCVRELMRLLNLQQTANSVGAETYINVLQKNSFQENTLTPAAVIGAKQLIVENSPSSEEFLKKYAEIKDKNSSDLDPFVILVSKIVSNGQLKSLVSQTSLNQKDLMATSLLEKSLLDPEKMKTGLSRSMPGSALSKQLRKSASRKNSIALKDCEIRLERPYLSLDFLACEDINEQCHQIGHLHSTLQESAIIQDILYCCEGLSGKYITPLVIDSNTSKRQFKIDSTLDISLKEMVERILPICSSYSTIIRFIETRLQYSYGLVNNALAAAIRSLLKNYMVLIAQLEHQNKTSQLTLQKLWYYLQSSIKTFNIIENIIYSLNKSNFIGGKILSILNENILNSIGDEDENQLCLFLMKACIKPYFEILEKWIYKGIIQDKHAEFMIVEKDKIQRDATQDSSNDTIYWDQKYAIRQDSVPRFLESFSDKILSTGKYLNVVRQTGRNIDYPGAFNKMEYEENPQKLHIILETAHEHASRTLLQMLITNYQLFARFKSLKHGFLLDHGDCIVQFMDVAEDEMMKQVPSSSTDKNRLLVRLQSLLELSIRMSVSNADPFKDDLKVDLFSDDLITQLLKILTIETKLEKDFKSNSHNRTLTCMEAFTFDYIVKWPLSIILSRKVLANYQMLFRHLFYAKHVERQLCNVWISDKASKISRIKGTQNLRTRAFSLRQRMLNFVQNLQHYMTFEVIEVHWKSFEGLLETASNIDEVLKQHGDFLNDCLNDCLLTNAKLLTSIYRLMLICIKFAAFMQSLGHPEEKQFESLTTSILKFDATFSKHLAQLLSNIVEASIATSKHSYMNILYRLDFNNYYKNNATVSYESLN